MVKLDHVESVSHETVRITLEKTNLSHGGSKPGIASRHNAGFVAQMEVMLDVYQRSYDPSRPVVYG